MLKKRNSFIYIFLLLALLADFGYSYYQYSLSALDGDLVPIVAPSESYETVLKEPFGWPAFAKGETYPATNRFTAHAVVAGYFRTMPFLLQHFVSPVESIYLSATLAKSAIHIALVFLLGWFVSGLFKFHWQECVIGAALVSPFLQTVGQYQEYMSIIDYSITYALFYALPVVCILLLCMPFYRSVTDPSFTFPLWLKPICLLLVVFLVFFGALPAPVLIIVVSIAAVYLFLSNFHADKHSSVFLNGINALKKINFQLLLFLTFTLIACLYSIYVGTKNSENEWSPLSLWERYCRLPKGIRDCFFNFETGPLYLLIALAINGFLLFIAKAKIAESKIFFRIVIFFAVFSCVYICLLPMGGYREYRPLILRRDTILPVLVLLYYCWAASSLFLLKNFGGIRKILFLFFVLAVSYFYTIKDTLVNYTNVREKEQLNILAAKAYGTEDCIVLKRDCSVMSWGYGNTCEDSRLIASMLYYWNITSRKVEFYQPEEKK